MEKINIEEQQKLITIKSKITAIENKKVFNTIINEKKDRLVAVLATSIPDLALYIRDLKETEHEIFSIIQDDLTDDLYNTVEWEKVKNYIKSSNNRFMKQELIIHTLSDFILESIDIMNDTSAPERKQQFSTLDEGEPKLTEEEREDLKRKAYLNILNYKEAGRAQRRIWIHHFLRIADTKEKFAIIDDIFFEKVGERVLSKELRERELKNKKEREAKS